MSKQFGERMVLKKVSARIMRGRSRRAHRSQWRGQVDAHSHHPRADRSRIVATVRLGTNLQVAYFDQLREQLDEELTVADTISPGSDWVEIGTERKHVTSYLADFLFPTQRAKSPVKMLSGGERNRLLLARLFARPANFIVLDEPTNDLDIESLELLEQKLQEYPGTLLLVEP